MRLWMTIFGAFLISISSFGSTAQPDSPEANVKGLILLGGFPRQGIHVKLESARSSNSFGPIETAADGMYSFSDVPPGEYVLNFWCPSGGEPHWMMYVQVDNSGVTEIATINISSDFDSYTTIGDPDFKLGGIWDVF